MMIINSGANMVGHTDNPPPYEDRKEDVDKQRPGASAHPGPSSPPIATIHPTPVPAMPQPKVYHYQNPATGEHVASLLPPDHPEMLCLQQGGHVPYTRFGLCGILAAIVWFPVGIACCLLDRRVQCKRCGVVIDQGVCD